tara:strand:- start:643 stop:822 length:180 start_codon:yes stop_codon:yes gene_type:complete
MKEALIIINLVVSASFLVLLNWWLYLRVKREQIDLERQSEPEIAPTSFMADLMRDEELY